MGWCDRGCIADHQLPDALSGRSNCWGKQDPQVYLSRSGENVPAFERLTEGPERQRRQPGHEQRRRTCGEYNRTSIERGFFECRNSEARSGEPETEER